MQHQYDHVQSNLHQYIASKYGKIVRVLSD